MKLAKEYGIPSVFHDYCEMLKERDIEMVFNPNIPALVDYPRTPIYEQRFRLPLNLEVDSNSATLGEYQLGAGRGSERFMGLAIAKGVGGEDHWRLFIAVCL